MTGTVRFRFGRAAGFARGVAIAFGAAIIAAGCALWRADPRSLNRGALVLVFDTSTAGDLKSLRHKLAEYDARATFFVAGHVNRGVARPLRDLIEDGCEVGLSGLRGEDPRHAMAVKGEQRYYQDEVALQVMDAEARGFRVNAFAFRPGKGTPEAEALLRSRGFKYVLANYTNDVDLATLNEAVSRNRVLIVAPPRNSLESILISARAADIPFATVSEAL